MCLDFTPRCISVFWMPNSLIIANSLSPNIMRLLHTIPFISIAVAITGVSENPATKPLGKRTACYLFNYPPGTCVDTTTGDSCPGGILVEGLCPGPNTEICCFNTPNECYTLCTSGWVTYIRHLQSKYDKKMRRWFRAISSVSEIRIVLHDF